MPQITSRERLTRQATLVPLVEGIAVRLLAKTAVSHVEAVQLECSPILTAPGWIMLTNSIGTGLAVCPRDVAQGRTSLRRRIGYARCLANVATMFSPGADEIKVRALDQESCPDDWIAYRVVVGSDEVWCAVSYPPPLLRPDILVPCRSLRRVRLGMRGWCAAQTQIADAVLGQYWLLEIQIQDCEATRYHLKVGEEGNMIVTKAEGETVKEDTSSLGVRLDLGEIEIELDELLNLRAGSTIELATQGRLRCFLRIGATTLASGEIVVNGDKLDVRVTEILHGE